MFPTTLKPAALVGSLLLTSTMAPAFTRAAAAASPESSSAPATAAGSTVATATTEHAALRDAIWQLEKSLRRRLAAAERGLRPAAVERSATEHPRDQRDRLAALGRAARRLGPAGAELARKARVLEPLVDEVERRERAGAAAQPASAWSVDLRSTRLAAAGAACSEAATIGAGRFLVEVGGGRADVWLQHRAEAAGMLLVSTAGSELDTVVEVYDGCPTPGARPVAAGDDEIGLQARAARRVAVGETSWIRVSGWEGAKGAAVVAVVEDASGFIGTVTREDNGQPLYDRYVYAWTSGGSYAGSIHTDSDGVYFFGGLSPGNYFASTAPAYYPDGLLEELYDDKPCPGGGSQGCNPTTGTPIAVTSGSILTGIDFALGPGGEVTGRVRDAATGAALAYAEVSIYNAAGNYIDDVGTDVAGRYTIGGLGTGSYYVVADGGYGTQYQPELYREVDCPSFSCNVTTGMPIPVTAGQTTTGIDFTLDKLGAIAGTLTQVQNGLPIPYGEVDVWDSQGDYVTWAYVNSSGQYTVGGLEPGNYFVRTYTGDYLDELYDNLPCSPCTPTSGTPIAVTLNHTASGIDFALRRNGSISGAITDAANGTPVGSYSVYVRIYDNNRNYVDSDYAYNGTYSFTGLNAGTYYVHAAAELYRSELYNDVPCEGGPPTGCSFAAGTPVVTQLDVATTGINFALTRLGSIAGTVIDQATAAPLNGATVYVWNAAGTNVGYGYTSSGAYEVKGLPAGTYYVTASSAEYLPELYNNLNCPGGGPPNCNPASGTPVSVSLGTTTSNVNFTLTRKGTIAGTVRDLSTSAQIYADISVYNAAGTFVASTYANVGTYEVRGLDAGNYFVVARNGGGYSARLYNGLPCPTGSCNPTAGTPVPVTINATTSGIDFNLPRVGTISGTVRSDAGPLSGINVGLYAANGTWLNSTSTGADGRYQLSADQGNWYVIAGSWSSEYATELYNDIPCPNNSCNPATGTPVGVALGATTPGIDFKLDASRGILGCVVNEAAQPLVGVAIDLWSPAGTHLATAVTGTNGCYRLLPNNSGTYFVSTDSGLQLVDEVWNDMACPLGSAYAGRCNPTAGTPINLPNWNSLATGVDFALGVGRIFRSGFESGDAAWIFWP